MNTNIKPATAAPSREFKSKIYSNFNKSAMLSPVSKIETISCVERILRERFFAEDEHYAVSELF